ncbi:MAG: hypothetical protein HC827_17400 [Cyanobacteria bacterium RM1_2_2]|nr:hypothetical protein [Cyanobacteria bacterium RM1_2_2]
MSRWRWLIGIVGLLCLGSGCNSKTAKQPQTVDIAGAEAPVESSVSEQAEPLAAQDFFPDPLIAGSASVKPLPMPNLIPPTTSIERVPQVDTGRPDPFASLNLAPTVVQGKPARVSAPPAPPVVPVPSAPVVSVAMPQSAAPALLPLPPLLPAAEGFNLPSLNVPQIPQRSLAETIEISGVVEVGGRKNVIVKVPDEHTSRYVAVGERMGNGTVLVKRVEMGLEPVVILEQEGREIVRSIGASGALVGTM